MTDKQKAGITNWKSHRDRHIRDMLQRMDAAFDLIEIDPEEAIRRGWIEPPARKGKP